MIVIVGAVVSTVIIVTIILGICFVSRRRRLGLALIISVCIPQVSEADLLKFGVLCNGYSGNVKRRCDSYGCGNYGAKRGGHLHKGLDIKCSDGSTVYAPFDAKLNGQARPYGNGNLIDDGITLSGKEAALLKFGVLCNGYSGNVKRRCDSYGCGNYGAKRGGHLHKGLDIKCSDGCTVYAPFDAKLNGQARPYGNGNLIDDGITLSGKGVCVKLFYVKPFNYRGNVKKGDKIGNLLPMQKVCSGITSHIHVQMCDKSDPTPYL
ncbi:UNVERIFIED_CONTAM: hypothetical protein FKN15_012261 [Acipenser sinensis]